MAAKVSGIDGERVQTTYAENVEAIDEAAPSSSIFHRTKNEDYRGPDSEQHCPVYRHTQEWIQDFIIKQNMCPFARAVVAKGEGQLAARG